MSGRTLPKGSFRKGYKTKLAAYLGSETFGRVHDHPSIPSSMRTGRRDLSAAFADPKGSIGKASLRDWRKRQGW